MARRVMWTLEAADDLDQVVAFIARDSERYARNIARRIVDVAEELPAVIHGARDLHRAVGDRV